MPDDTIVIGSTWEIKKNPTGTRIDRLNDRGREQIDGIHYDSKDMSSPVVNGVTFRVILAIMLTFRMLVVILDVKFMHR